MASVAPLLTFFTIVSVLAIIIHHKLSWPLFYLLGTQMVTVVLKIGYNRQKFYILKMFCNQSTEATIFYRSTLNFLVVYRFWFDKSNRQLGNSEIFLKKVFVYRDQKLLAS
jgi:hypothetical protein